MAGPSLPGIYVQKLDANWNAKWAPNGLAMGAGVDTASVLASDGSGGALITWMHSTPTVPAIYAQRVDINGNLMWTSGGIVISDSTYNNSGGLNIASDGNGGAIIGWIDGHIGGGRGFLYGQRVDINGNAKWAAGGVAVSTPSKYSVMDIQLVNDGGSGTIFTWYDSRNSLTTGKDIFAQKVFSDGTLALTCGDPVTIAGTSYTYTSIQTAYETVGDGSSIQIQVQATAFSEDLHMDKDIIVQLKGGYKCDSTNPMLTSLYGTLTISGGSVAVENLIVQ